MYFFSELDWKRLNEEKNIVVKSKYWLLHSCLLQHAHIRDALEGYVASAPQLCTHKSAEKNMGGETEPDQSRHTHVFGERAACLLPNNKYFTGLLFVFFSFAGGEHQTTTTRKGKMLISVLLYMMMMLMIEKKINMTWHTHHIMTKELDDELIMIIFSSYLVLPPTIIYNKRKILHITLDLMNVTPLLFGIIQTQCKLLYRNVKKINIWTTCCQKFSLSHMFLHDIEYTCLVQV